LIYRHPIPGIFLSRPNRFIAMVQVKGQVHRCHVKNTGRCKELLLPGVPLILDKAANPARLTPYDVVAVYKGDTLINIDSSAPNKAFGEYLQSGGFLPGLTIIRPETKFGDSRFDFYAETSDKKIFIEIKGVTLEEDGVALFPDAPTLRGTKHLGELARAVSLGYESHAVFVIQMKGCSLFRPNHRTDAAFAHALVQAAQAGVHLWALDCQVTESSMEIGNPVRIELE